MDTTVAIGGIGLGAILGFGFDPKKACGTYAAVYPITCFVLGTIGLAVNFYNTKQSLQFMHCYPLNQQVATTINERFLKHDWIDLHPVYKFPSALVIGSAIDTFGGLYCGCRLSSQIFPIILIFFSALGLTMSLISTRANLKKIQDIKKNGTVSDLQTWYRSRAVTILPSQDTDTLEYKS